jgi:hypothetical protein
MVDKNALEAPCGIHCGLCPLHLAITDESLKKRLAERLNMPLDRVVCPGCREIDGFCPIIPEQCATWLCVNKKAVEFCCECADFPCIKLAPCADKASLRPHNIKVYSLTLRKNKGAYEWNKAIEEIYSLYYKGEMIIGHGPVLKQ